MTNINRKVLIIASGGGHTGYAIGLAQHLENSVDMTFMIPAKDQWSLNKIKKYGECIEIVKGRGPTDPLYVFIPRLMKAFWQSLFEVKGNYDVVATGSNHSIPPAIISKIKSSRLFNIESSVRFIKPSKTARILNTFCDMTILQWEEQLQLFKKGEVVGPIYEKPLYEVQDKGYILVTGGTWGYKELFDKISEAELDNVILQTGRIDPEPYRKKHPNWIVFDFDPDFAKYIAGARTVITHFGKTIIDASLTYRKPVVVVVNPKWTRTAGEEDARILSEKTNSLFMDSLTKSNIEEAISYKGISPRYKNGAEHLAKIILGEV